MHSLTSETFVEAAKHQERLTQLDYEERIINVDHGLFCPLVFLTFGAAGRLATCFMKSLAGKIAEKGMQEVSFGDGHGMDQKQAVICSVAECSGVRAWLSLQSPLSAWCWKLGKLIAMVEGHVPSDEC